MDGEDNNVPEDDVAPPEPSPATLIFSTHSTAKDSGGSSASTLHHWVKFAGKINWSMCTSSTFVRSGCCYESISHLLLARSDACASFPLFLARSGVGLYHF